MSINSPLLTDLYQLTMAYGYWYQNIAEREAVFNLFFRKNPFNSDYAVSAGLASVIDYCKNFRFSDDELRYLATLTGAHDTPLFSQEFLDYLKNLKFQCDIDAMPEGELVFANEPFVRVKGPILQCQLIETALINLMNFASLIATKASRVYFASGGDSVIEFGLRRAQGPDGGMTASRAAFIGGCDSTSNVLAGKNYGIPVRGTVAHSWIMAYADEMLAFEKFVEALPQIAVLLVDTYDTIAGVKNAILIGKKLQKQNHQLLGIRLDSGDLAKLSKDARQLLDAAGFKDTQIIASGDLDEYRIAELKKANAPIDVWGVGTRLSTSYDQPSLDAAYKLGAIRDENNEWQYRLKKSDTPAKTTNPGILQVRRFYQNNDFVQDILFDELLGCEKSEAEQSTKFRDLLVPIFKNGHCVYDIPPITESRKISIENVSNFKNSGKTGFALELDKKLAKVKKDLLEKVGK